MSGFAPTKQAFATLSPALTMAEVEKGKGAAPVEVGASHLGMAVDPDVVVAVLTALARDRAGAASGSPRPVRPPRPVSLSGESRAY